jgi:hypothetical protein
MKHKFFLYVGLAVISIPVYLLIGKVLFGSLEKFKDCLSDGSDSSYGFAQSAGSAWAEIRLYYFVGLCAAAVYGESILLLKFLPGTAEAIHKCTMGILLFVV